MADFICREYNVMSTEWGICLSYTRIDEKSNEIPEMQEVMGKFDCRGCVVIADAMNTQKDTDRVIVKKANGDYCLALKENQKNAYHEVKEYFANEGFLKEIMAADGQYLKETEKTASETIVREYFMTSDIKWSEDRKEWEKLKSVGYEKKTITRKRTEDTIIDKTQLYSTRKELDGKCMYQIHNRGTENEYHENYYYVLEAKLVLHEDIIVGIMTEFVTK